MVKKFSVKDLKSPDRLFKAMLTFVHYLRDNVKLLLTVAGVVVAITAVVVIFNHIKGSREEAARVSVYNMNLKIQQLDSDKEEKVISVIRDELANLKNSSAKLEATYKLAEKYYKAKDWHNAIKTYGELADESDGILKELSLLGIAYSKEMKGDVSGALEDFKTIKDMDATVYKAVAMLGIGRCYQKLGQKDKALAAFDLVIISYPETDFARLASASKAGL